MRKNFAGVVSVLLVLLMVLAACSSPNTSSSTGNTSSGTSNTPSNSGNSSPSTDNSTPSDSSDASTGSDSGDNVHIRFMTWEGEAMNNAMLASMVDKIPGVTVELEPSPLTDYGIKLQEMLAADMAPDVFMAGNDMALNYHAEGLVVDVKPYMDADPDFANGFYPGTLTSYTVGNEMVGLPGLINMYGIFYNKKYFDDAGLEYPHIGWTYDDMYAAAEKLKDESANRYGLYQKTNDVFNISIYSASKDGTPFTDTIYPVTKVQASESFLEGLTKVQTAVQSKAMTEPTFDDTNVTGNFMQGAIPMLKYGQWAADELIRNAPADLDWGYAPTPLVKDNAQIIDPVGWCINKATKDPDAAFKVLKFISTDTYNVVLAETPVAPPAYQPAAEGYYKTLTESGHNDLAEGLDYMLTADIKLPVRFLDTWGPKANKFLDADWASFVTGEYGTDQVQTRIIDNINEVIK